MKIRKSIVIVVIVGMAMFCNGFAIAGSAFITQKYVSEGRVAVTPTLTISPELQLTPISTNRSFELDFSEDEIPDGCAKLLFDPSRGRITLEIPFVQTEDGPRYFWLTAIQTNPLRFQLTNHRSAYDASPYTTAVTYLNGFDMTLHIPCIDTSDNDPNGGNKLFWMELNYVIAGSDVYFESNGQGGDTEIFNNITNVYQSTGIGAYGLNPWSGGGLSGNDIPEKTASFVCRRKGYDRPFYIETSEKPSGTYCAYKADESNDAPPLYGLIGNQGHCQSCEIITGISCQSMGSVNW